MALIWLLLGKEAHTELACLLKSSKISLVRYIATSAIECYGSTRNKFRDRYSLATWESVVEDRRQTTSESTTNTLKVLYLLAGVWGRR